MTMPVRLAQLTLGLVLFGTGLWLGLVAEIGRAHV